MSSGKDVDEKGSDSKQSSWQELFDQHLKVLKEHLNLWNDVKSKHLLENDKHGAAQVCLDQTQDMIHNVQRLQTAFNHDNRTQESIPSAPAKLEVYPPDSSNIRPPLPYRKIDVPLQTATAKQQGSEANSFLSSVPRHNSPVRDSSGLFSIDTRPTPVEQLQTTNKGKRADSQLKRKLSETHVQAIGSFEPLQETSQIHKRPRHLTNNPAIHHNIDIKKAHTDDDDGEADSFIAKVQQRYEEKELKRQQKPEKKRKRESNNSLEDHASGSFKPGKKKAKGGNSTSTNLTKESNKLKKRRFADAERNTGKRNKV